jgi:hypothetical protein
MLPSGWCASFTYTEHLGKRRRPALLQEDFARKPSEVSRDLGVGTKKRGNLNGCLALSLPYAPGGTRTPNLLIRSQMLYPIELRALIQLCSCSERP